MSESAYNLFVEQKQFDFVGGKTLDRKILHQIDEMWFGLSPIEKKIWEKRVEAKKFEKTVI